MTILRWTPRPLVFRAPWRELEKLRNHVEAMYDTLAEGVDSIRRASPGVYPALNVSEDGERLHVTAELPGVSASDIEVSVHGDSLTIRGERKIPEAGQEVNYHRREREAGVFRRVLNLPVRIDAGKVEANFSNGILTIKLPKAAESKAYSIAIQAD